MSDGNTGPLTVETLVWSKRRARSSQSQVQGRVQDQGVGAERQWAHTKMKGRDASLINRMDLISVGRWGTWPGGHLGEEEQPGVM